MPYLFIMLAISAYLIFAFLVTIWPFYSIRIAHRNIIKFLHKERGFSCIFKNSLDYADTDFLSLMPSRLILLSAKMEKGYTFPCSNIRLTSFWFNRAFINSLCQDYKNSLDTETADVYLCCTYENKIGPVPKIKNYIINSEFKSVISEIKNRVISKKEKYGLLLYGAPGNGKTSFIKYICHKFNLSLYVPAVSDMNNNSFENLFAMVTQRETPCVVLFEDFDNIFYGRDSQGTKVTFDTVLNCIDGPYFDISNVIIVFTANDISKIDSALKNRPGRIDRIVHIDNPEKSVIKEYLELKLPDSNIDELSTELDGCSMALVDAVVKNNGEEIDRIMDSFQYKKKKKVGF